MLCIIANSVLLASKDYREVYDISHKSEWNELLEIFDSIFSAIFVFECAFKVVVMGFVKHRNAYLK